MDFEWDSAKAAANYRKHGIAFLDAITVFDDPFALRVDDVKHSSLTERRYWQIGESDRGVVVVVFTIRGELRSLRYRIITARPASKRERVLYEISKRFPV